jgi:hypothetical protein
MHPRVGPSDQHENGISSRYGRCWTTSSFFPRTAETPTYNEWSKMGRTRGGLYMRATAICIAVLGQMLVANPALAQQQSADANSATVFCDFDDNQEISVRYNNVVSSKDEPHNGKVWLPGGSPLTFFVGAPISLKNTPIPVGAYSVYVIPNRKEWTLIVNKNVTPGAAYDQTQDIARGPMELGEVDSPPGQLQVSLAHTGPKQCSIRLYYGKVGAFTEFVEK